MERATAIEAVAGRRREAGPGAVIVRITVHLRAERSARPLTRTAAPPARGWPWRPWPVTVTAPGRQVLSAGVGAGARPRAALGAVGTLALRTGPRGSAWLSKPWIRSRRNAATRARPSQAESALSPVAGGCDLDRHGDRLNLTVTVGLRH